MSDWFTLGDATWPAARLHPAGAFLVREGAGGGNRVSAATLADPGWSKKDLEAAEAAQAGLGQPALFMIRPGDEALDAELAARGYVVKDPVRIYAGSTASVAEPPPPFLATFALWPPLAIMDELWEEGGIGPARRAVMARVAGPRTALLGRIEDRAAGVAFAAIHDGSAMIHALWTAPRLRRKGVAAHLARAAAAWAHAAGAHRLALLVTEANTAANALYASLGMEAVGRYHYRIKPPGETGSS